MSKWPCSSEAAKGMLTRCLRECSFSFRAGIAYADAYAGLRTPGFCFREVEPRHYNSLVCNSRLLSISLNVHRTEYDTEQASPNLDKFRRTYDVTLARVPTAHYMVGCLHNLQCSPAAGCLLCELPELNPVQQKS